MRTDLTVPSVLVLAALCVAAKTRGGGEETALDPPASARWEFHLLGVDTPAKLEALRGLTKHRRVVLGVVGQSGVSKGPLAKHFRHGNTLSYQGCADPGRSTHDTGQLRAILDLTDALGVSLDVHVWQPGESFLEVADAMRAAAKVADIVVFYQSFWGSNAAAITEAIRESPSALFVSPYVEHGGNPTSECPQGSACRPWREGSIAHFVLAAPLARKGRPGDILSPADRGPGDSEAINFIAPSHHASGPGGTCPAASVATACAAYLHATLQDSPKPVEIVDLLRRNSVVDEELLSAAPGFDAAAVERLQGHVRALLEPGQGEQRKLDARGVLNLQRAVQAAALNATVRDQE